MSIFLCYKCNVNIIKGIACNRSAHDRWYVNKSYLPTLRNDKDFSDNHNVTLYTSL